jgi:hypothetical protein
MAVVLGASSVEPRAPGVRDMLPPVVIAPLVAAGAFGAATQTWPAAQLAAIVAVITIVLIGWPIVFWMVDNGRPGPIARTIGGAICGAAPFAAGLVSGVIGLYARMNDLAYVRWVLEKGASVPYYGVYPWPLFGWWTALGIGCGIATLWLSHLISARVRPL